MPPGFLKNAALNVLWKGMKCARKKKKKKKKEDFVHVLRCDESFL